MPEVRFNGTVVEGWEAFDAWARHNLPAWNRVVIECHYDGTSEVDKLKFLAAFFVNEWLAVNHQMTKWNDRYHLLSQGTQYQTPDVDFQFIGHTEGHLD